MEDHFAAMNAAEIRKEYWGEASNDFTESKQVKKPDPFARLLRREGATQKNNKASREIGVDHYGLAGQWKLDERPIYLPAYFVGQRIEFDIGFPDSACPDTGEHFLVEVLKLLGEPRKSGCVMLVRCIESQQARDVDQKFVLKVIDPRFCPLVYGRYTSMTALQHFVDMLNSGTATEFLKALPTDHSKDFLYRLLALSDWQKLIALTYHGHHMAKKEAIAYRHLQELQGYHIPKFYYEVCIRPWIQVLPHLQTWSNHTASSLNTLKATLSKPSKHGACLATTAFTNRYTKKLFEFATYSNTMDSNIEAWLIVRF